MLAKYFTLLLFALCVGGPLVSEASSVSIAAGYPELKSSVGGNSFGRLKDAIVDCTRQVGKVVHEHIRPQVEYFQLMQRFNKWQRSYNSLLETTGSANNQEYLKANELVKRIFGQVDNELFLEMEARAEKRRELAAELGEDLRQVVGVVENTDYLYEVLKRLVNRLEQLNELPVRRDGPEVGESENSSRLESEAIERAKRIALLSARDFFAVELLQVSRIAALNALAAYLASSPPTPDSALAVIAPLVMMLGNPQASIASSYITNLKFRHAIGWLDAVNPVPNLVSSIFGRMANSTSACRRH